MEAPSGAVWEEGQSRHIGCAPGTSGLDATPDTFPRRSEGPMPLKIDCPNNDHQRDTGDRRMNLFW